MPDKGEVTTGHIVLGVAMGVACVAVVAQVIPFLALAYIIDTLAKKPA